MFFYRPRRAQHMDYTLNCRYMIHPSITSEIGIRASLESTRSAAHEYNLSGKHRWNFVLCYIPPP